MAVSPSGATALPPRRALVFGTGFVGAYFVAAHAYRIGREALTNAVRHAEAHHAEVVLSVGDGRLHLVVADDGRGLPDRVRPGANGLRSMRNRAQALGGELRITRGEGGRGTVVAFHAPLGEAS